MAKMTRIAVAVLAVMVAAPAVAESPAIPRLPSGGVVVSGTANILYPSTPGTQTYGTRPSLNVQQTSDRAIINWSSFSIAPDHTVVFQQPSASSAVLNRVTSSLTSRIAGSLQANGRVYLVNTNGIQITPTGTIQASTFVASSFDASNDSFNRGSPFFRPRDGYQGYAIGAVQAPGYVQEGPVLNEGTITVTGGGDIALIGPRGTVNRGTLDAPNGRVATFDDIGDVSISQQRRDENGNITNGRKFETLIVFMQGAPLPGRTQPEPNSRSTTEPARQPAPPSIAVDLQRDGFLAVALPASRSRRAIEMIREARVAAGAPGLAQTSAVARYAMELPDGTTSERVRMGRRGTVRFGR